MLPLDDILVFGDIFFFGFRHWFLAEAGAEREAQSGGRIGGARAQPNAKPDPH